jgi:hypothetical protein
LNAAIVVRIHEGERRCSSAEERRSHTAKVGCSNQPTGTNPCGSSVARTPECESGGRRFDSVPRDQISDGRCRRRTDQHRPSVLCHPSFEGGCSSAEERRSPKPRQRGFDPCLPRQLPGRPRYFPARGRPIGWQIAPSGARTFWGYGATNPLSPVRTPPGRVRVTTATRGRSWTPVSGPQWVMSSIPISVF